MTAIRTISKTISAPGTKTRSVPVAADTTTRNSLLSSQKGFPLGTPKVCNFLHPPESTRSKGPIETGAGEWTPQIPRFHSRGLATTAQTFAHQGSKGEFLGLSGVMARSKDLQRGYSHPGIHVAERKSSELRSSHSMRIPDRQDLVVQMSCYAASDWFTEKEKGRVKI